MTLSFQKLTLAAAAAVLCFGLSGPARAELSKADVEQIVRDYIAAHPEEIIASVQNHQDKSVRTRQKDAVKANSADLYKDKDSPFAGNPNGDVTVVEFFDYNCGYCKKVLPQVQQLIEQDKGVRVLFKDFPILGPTSETAAKWALAAHKQGKYFEYHQVLMENHAPISDQLLEDLAKKVGLDVAKAKADADGSDILIQIERNRSLAANMDIRGTPAFVVGEELAPGAISLESMKEMIEKVRNDAKAPKTEEKKEEKKAE